MKISCTRRIEFDTAHRIPNHESKCKLLHGHRYAAEVSFRANELDSLGRIIDFGAVKEILQTWIDNNWDHNAVLHKDDKDLGDSIAKTTKQKIYYLDVHPTAENMAAYLLKKICYELFKNSDVEAYKIKLYETPNCYAEVEI